MQKTTLRQNVKNTDRKWFVIDANEKTLGKLSVAIANALRGKHRIDFTPHSDGGDYVVVINAEKVAVTGRKESDKKYYTHSGQIGNLKTKTLSTLRKESPKRILELSVKGMLPKNKLRDEYMRRLYLIIGEKNPHISQNPEPLPFK